jgi:hypothetical protein
VEHFTFIFGFERGWSAAREERDEFRLGGTTRTSRTSVRETVAPFYTETSREAAKGAKGGVTQTTRESARGNNRMDKSR